MGQKKVISYVILAIFLFNTNLAFSCEKDVTYLKKGQTTPCEGFLFSPEKEQAVRLKDVQFDYIKQITEKQTEVIQIMDKRITNLQEYNTLLSNELNKREKFSFLKTTLYFGLGVLATSIIYDHAKD